MNDTCQAHIERIDELLENRLTAEERAALHGHLAECAECRGEMETALRLRTLAKELPAEIAPQRDLWSEIASRIGATEPAATGPAPTRVIELAPRRARREWYSQRAPLAAAALLLVVLSSAITAAVIRSSARQPGSTALTPVEVNSPIPASFAAFAPAEREYRETVESLEAEFDARRAELAPETVEVVERNLAIIDQAIAEARAALTADPGSTELPIHLSDVYRRKVDLLQSVISI